MKSNGKSNIGSKPGFDGMSSFDRLDKIHNRLVEVSSLTNTPSKEQQQPKNDVDDVTNLKPMRAGLFGTPSEPSQQNVDNYSRGGIEINTQMLRKIVLGDASDIVTSSTIAHPTQAQQAQPQPRVTATFCPPQGTVFGESRPAQQQAQAAEAKPAKKRRSIYALPSPTIQIPLESNILRPISYDQSPLRAVPAAPRLQQPSTASKFLPAVAPSSSSSSSTLSIQNPLLKSKVRKSMEALMPDRYHQIESIFSSIATNNDVGYYDDTHSAEAPLPQQPPQSPPRESFVRPPRKSIFAPPSPSGKFVLEKQHSMFAPLPQLGPQKQAPVAQKRSVLGSAHSGDQAPHHIPLVKRQTAVQTPKKPQHTASVSALSRQSILTSTAAKQKPSISAIQRPSVVPSTAVKQKPLLSTVKKPTTTRKSLLPSFHGLVNLGTPKTPKASKSRIATTSTVAPSTSAKTGVTRQSLASVKKAIIPIKPAPLTGNAKKETVPRKSLFAPVPKAVPKKQVASTTKPTTTTTRSTTTRTTAAATRASPTVSISAPKAPQSGIRRPSMYLTDIGSQGLLPRGPLASGYSGPAARSSSVSSAVASKVGPHIVAGKSAVIPSSQKRDLLSTAKKSTPKKTLTRKPLIPLGFGMVNLGDGTTPDAKPRSQALKKPLSHQTPKKQPVHKTPKKTLHSMSSVSTVAKQKPSISVIQRPSVVPSTAVKQKPLLSTVKKPTTTRKSLLPSFHGLVNLGTPKTPKASKSRMATTSTVAPSTSAKTGVTRQSLASVKKAIIPIKPAPLTGNAKKETVPRKSLFAPVPKAVPKKQVTSTTKPSTATTTTRSSSSSSSITRPTVAATRASPTVSISAPKAPQSGIRRPSMYLTDIGSQGLLPRGPLASGYSGSSVSMASTLAPRVGTPTKEPFGGMGVFSEKKVVRPRDPIVPRTTRRSLMPSFMPVDLGDQSQDSDLQPPKPKRRTTTIGLPSSLGMYQASTIGGGLGGGVATPGKTKQGVSAGVGAGTGARSSGTSASRVRRSLLPSAMDFVNLGPTTGGTLFLLRDGRK